MSCRMRQSVSSCADVVRLIEGARQTPIARDAAALDLGLDIRLAPRATFGVSYDGQFGSGLSDHSAKANLTIRF